MSILGMVIKFDLHLGKIWKSWYFQGIWDIVKTEKLIETWDVLKSKVSEIPDFGAMINRNMRCIEIAEKRCTQKITQD